MPTNPAEDTKIDVSAYGFFIKTESRWFRDRLERHVADSLRDFVRRETGYEAMVRTTLSDDDLGESSMFLNILVDGGIIAPLSISCDMTIKRGVPRAQD